MLVWPLLVARSSAEVPLRSAECPLASTTNVVYSTVSGVGTASRIWTEDLLEWWRDRNPAIEYQSLDETQLSQCDARQFANVRLFVNPGGDAYDQLTALGPANAQLIKDIVEQGTGYAGFCAGAYLAAPAYVWETVYESGYLGIFPHAVEGSIVDVADYVGGGQDGREYRLVNVSNGHKMLYYGGSTFGWNALEIPKVRVVLWFSDFYGFLSPNLPAAWVYENLFLTSIHAEADNCTVGDCPDAGTIPAEDIEKNRAWLVTHLAGVSGLDAGVTVPPASLNETKPHHAYPSKQCVGVFCDDFDALDGTVPSGLWQWQRNQSDFTDTRPWNLTYQSSWGGVQYATPYAGNGYAYAVPQSTRHASTITSATFATETHATLFFAATGRNTHPQGLVVDVQRQGVWTLLHAGPLPTTWTTFNIPLPPAPSLRLRFSCFVPDAAKTNFCALDSLAVTEPPMLQG